MLTIQNENEFIIKTLFVFVSPYRSSGLKKSVSEGDINLIGSVQASGLIGRLIESKNPNICDDTIITGRMACRRFILANDTELRFRIVQKPTEKNTIYDEIGFRSAPGVLEMSSQTAYYGILSVANRQSTHVFVISGAQKVIGIAGGEKNVITLSRN